MTIDLAHLEALANAATPGPWITEGSISVEPKDMVVAERDGHVIDLTERGGIDYGGGEFLRVEDAAFVAAAREAVPTLIARIRQLEGLLDRADTRVHLLGIENADLRRDNERLRDLAREMSR